MPEPLLAVAPMLHKKRHRLAGLTESELASEAATRRGNTAEQVDRLIEAVAAPAAHLRRLSPIYA